MDDAIGELLALLDEYEIADNTIVIFFSDNGGGGGSDNGPLKGGKGWMFEGGIRVPCMVRYPGRIQQVLRATRFSRRWKSVPTVLLSPPASACQTNSS